MSRRAALHTIGAGLAIGSIGRHTSLAMQATPLADPELAFPVADQVAFEAIVDGALAATATPGALVGIWYPGRGTWLKAAGIGDIETGSPISLDDHVRIASITKTFVATVILQLAGEGLLALDDPLEAHIAGIPNGPEITIRQVLAMSAGIHDYVTEPEFVAGYSADPMFPYTPQDALAVMRASTPDFAPGERVQYSNSNYVLLGLIAESLTSASIGELIADRISGPLGLRTTTFATTPDLPTPFAHGYDGGEPGTPLRDVSRSNPDVAWASGAMVSTLGDLGTWAKALAEGSLLAPAMQEERLAFGLLQAEPIEVGYGLGILTFGGLLGHNGGIAGYSLWMVHEPASGATVVIVTNRGGAEAGTSDQIFGPLAGYLFPQLIPS
jgi:D-alanyl-D-alanine carboxypeptidase